MSYDGKRILVTGGNGFLGKHLCEALNRHGATVLYPNRDRHSDDFVDLTLTDAVEDLFLSAGKLDYVFHLAGFNGGIKYNVDRPAEIFFRNTVMGLNVVDACWRFGAGKFVGVVASCAYPEFEVDWRGGELSCAQREVCNENGFFDGPPNWTVAPHAYAKRNLQLACQFYHTQFGLNAVCLCPTTLFGPGDTYDPDRTKLVGAMVKRFVDAKDDGANEVVCWGSGRPMRELLYVEDAAAMIAVAALKYRDSQVPLNLGSGWEVSVAELAELVAERVQFGGAIRFDTSKPDGQFRKRLDCSRSNELVPCLRTEPTVALDATIEDYRARKRSHPTVGAAA